MAIIDWTSEGMDWSSLKYKMLNPYLEALKLALVERMNAADMFVSPLLSAGFSTYDLLLAGAAGSFGRVFEAAITNLITGAGTNYPFINQTDSGGVWTGIGTEAPIWTEADMLTAIGAPSRILLNGAGTLFTEDWALQQYNILNKLVWNKHSLPQVGGDARKSNNNSNWATCVAQFNAASWNPFSQADPNAYHFAVRGATYNITRLQCVFRFGNISILHAHEFQAYTKFTKTGAGVPTIHNYENNDYATMAENLYNLYSSGGPSTPAAARRNVVVGDIDTNSCSQPDFGDAYGWVLTNSNAYVVLKWNVTGGFDFVA